MADKFTAEQVHDWYTYESVRQEGLFNMFDPAAIITTGLSREEYFFVMSNYSELEQQAKKEGTK